MSCELWDGLGIAGWFEIFKVMELMTYGNLLAISQKFFDVFGVPCTSVDSALPLLADVRAKPPAL